MVRILPFILIFLLISPTIVSGQKKKEVWRYEGPRIGIDMSRFILPYMQKAKRIGLELQADYPIKGNWFPTVEAGYQSFDDTKDNFRYQNNGVYGRIGTDLNIVKFESLQDNDLVLVGVRYGYSRFKHSADQVTYTNYWGNLQTSFPQKAMNAHWFELLFGMKGELLPNIFFGWTARTKLILAMTKDINMTPYIVPGIGKTSNGTSFDFSLTLSYRFPIYKTKVLPKPIKTGGSKSTDSDQDEDPQNDEYNNGTNSRGSLGPGSLNGGSRNMP